MKKIIISLSVISFALVVAVNINSSLNGNAEIDMSLANVEALANGESSPRIYCCHNGDCAWGQSSSGPFVINGIANKNPC